MALASAQNASARSEPRLAPTPAARLRVAALVTTLMVASLGGVAQAASLLTDGSFDNANIGVSNYTYPGGTLGG